MSSLELIRSVALDAEHEKTLRDITQNDNPKAPFEYFYSAITFCAALGFSQAFNNMKPNSKNIQMDAIKPDLFSKCEGDKIALLIALLHTKSYDKIIRDENIKEDADYVSIFIGYANAGLEIIEDWRTQYNGDNMNTTEIILWGLQKIRDKTRKDNTNNISDELSVSI